MSAAREMAQLRAELRDTLKAIHWRLDGISRELRAMRELHEETRLSQIQMRLRPLAKAYPREEEG